MDNVTITSNSTNLVVNKSITASSINAETISVDEINVATDVYINSAIYTPVGSIVTYAGSTSPSGWLFCNGSEVSKTTYARLYAIIGTTYGTAANSANFVLPNLEDRIPVGKSGATSVGNTGGNSSVTLSVAQLPSHTHTGTTDASGSHTHIGTTDTNGAHSHSITDPGHTHTQTTINDDFNNSGASPPGFSADSAGSRTWNNISTAYTGISVNSSGSHTHTFTTGSTSAHAHTFTTNATGSGTSIDIRNKFVVMNYIIRY
jgi:microcystin-dependent protein